MSRSSGSGSIPQTATHLQDISDGEVDVSLAGGVVVFGAFDDHQMRWGIHTPCKSAGGHKHLGQSQALSTLSAVITFLT